MVRWTIGPTNGFAKGEPESDGHSVNGRPGERGRQGWRALDCQAEQDCVAQAGDPWASERSRNA